MEVLAASIFISNLRTASYFRELVAFCMGSGFGNGPGKTVGKGGGVGHMTCHIQEKKETPEGRRAKRWMQDEETEVERCTARSCFLFFLT